MPVKNMPQLIHRLRIDLQRLLKELDAQEHLRPPSGAKPRLFRCWIDANATAHNPEMSAGASAP